MKKQAVYGEDENGIMRLIARDLDAAQAKEKADEHWKNTGHTAIIVKQQHGSFVMDKIEDCIEDLEAENARLRTTVESYATSARVIALYLDRWFDRNLPYSDGIAEAARKAADYIEDLERKLNSND